MNIAQPGDELAARLASLRTRIGAGPDTELPTDGEPACGHCGGVGWVTLVDRGYQMVRRCGCAVEGLYADGTPYEFQSARLDNYREDDGNRTALAKARAFLTGSRDLYLVGTVGGGKTRLACSILNEYAKSRQTCLFARVPMLLHQLQPGHDGAALEQRLFTTSLLVLDDLAAERDQATDYTRRTLLMIYEERGDRGLRTIFTSNKTVGELAQMQDDDRLSSRIAGRADVVKLTTPDQRMLRRAKDWPTR